MQIAEVINGEVVKVVDCREELSLPYPPTRQDLELHGFVMCNIYRPHDRLTQKLVQCSPILEGEWVYLVEVVDKTEDEIANDKWRSLCAAKVERNRRLVETDWTQCADVADTRLTAQEVADFAAYRAEVWDLVEQMKAGVIDPRLFVQWPVRPDQLPS